MSDTPEAVVPIVLTKSVSQFSLRVTSGKRIKMTLEFNILLDAEIRFKHTRDEVEQAAALSQSSAQVRCTGQDAPS